MQRELSVGPLLNRYGNLNEAGYATELVKEYNRKHIKAPKGRIKEWDYYYVGTPHYGVALTIADNSYMGLLSVTFLDFVKGQETTKSVMLWFTWGKLHLPSTSKSGNVIVNHKDMRIAFMNDGLKRILQCEIPDFSKGTPFSCHIELSNPSKDSMVIATPFPKAKHFYYNQKINCLEGAGWVKVGDSNYDFASSLGVLDWGRGVWTYRNTWYWSSLSVRLGEDFVGFNLGYGFGDTSAASENMLFLNGQATKIDEVRFKIPTNDKGEDDYLSPWTITDSDGLVNLTFEPILDRHSNTSALVIASNQHQVFGKFSGTLNCQEKVIHLKDALGFAEKVMNKW
ncbi:MAG: DUF2804 domain-containing protein [Bacilli bacterium]|nr:DUF2804 domain-containing protein [Bacilli bacterium]